MLCTSVSYGQSPLPPIDSHPVWRVGWYSFGGFFEVHEYTYGDQYTACDQQYVAILSNDTIEVMYIRMTEDKAYYLLDLENCANEHLFYDYSFTEDITVEMHLTTTDSFQNINVHLNAEFAEATLLGDEGRYVTYTSQLTFPNVNHSDFWYKGVGDLSHPFYPIANDFHPLQEGSYGLQSLEVNQLLWYCGNFIDCTPNQIIYVDKDVEGGLQNGVDWENAYASLEFALNVADSADVLWVADGIYTVNELSGRSASFVVRDGISIYGGFQGNETLFIDRNPAVYPTILSGDIGIVGDSTDNSYHVIRIQNVAAFAVLDGIQIKDGNALGGEIDFPFSKNGGAILVFSALAEPDTAKIYINDCVLSQNTALLGGALAFHKDYEVPTILDINAVKLENNFASFLGGAIYIPDLSPISLKMNINDVHFLKNRSSDGGAVFEYHSGSEWEISNSRFFQNTVPNGGGGAFRGEYTEGTKNITIINTHFEKNTCTSTGGAISIVHLGGELFVNLSLKQSVFIENRSFANSGGAVGIGSQSLLGLSLSLDHCDFIRNRALTDGANIFIESEIGYDGKIDIDYCTFKENAWGPPGGGAFWLRMHASLNNFIPRLYEMNIRNSLFVNNKGAITQSGINYGSAIVDSIINCTFVNNGSYPLVKNHTSAHDGDLYKNDMYLRNCIKGY